jgi:hypothetical protein
MASEVFIRVEASSYAIVAKVLNSTLPSMPLLHANGNRLGRDTVRDHLQSAGTRLDVGRHIEMR